MKTNINNGLKTSMIHILILVALTGCIKKRPDQFMQGSGLANGDVVTKDSVLKVQETLTAKEKIQDATAREYKLTIEKSANGVIDDLGYVVYETNSNLLNNNPRFIGKPGATYSLRRELQGERLLVYKVSKPENISYIEKTNLVKNFENGLIGVPLLSFPVSYYVVEHITDADRRKTNQKRERQIIDPSKFQQATHILVNWSNRTVFTESGIDKSSMFAKSMFKEGEWYYSVFRTDSSDFSAGGNSFQFIGSKETAQFGILRSVKFQEIDQNTFAGISSTLPSEIAQKDLNKSIVAPLSVNWIKLRVNARMSGVEDEQLDTTGNFRDSEFFQIDFLKSFELLSQYFIERNHGEMGRVNKVDEVIIGDGLVSFIVSNNANTFRVNFMKKKSSNYKALSTHYIDTLNKFGTMYANLPTHLTSQKLQSEEDFYRYYRTIRFDPAKKTIVYHISEESPDAPSVQKSAERAIKYLDDSFKHIYKDAPSERIRVVLSNQRVRRGDPRYNIIDYNSENNPNTSGGLGNPYYDELTGEVISATSFIYYGISDYLLKSALSEFLGVETNLHITADLHAVGSDQANLAFHSQNTHRGSYIYMPKEYGDHLSSSISQSVLGNMMSFIPGVGQTLLKPCFGGSCAESSGGSSAEELRHMLADKPTPLAERFIKNAVNHLDSVNDASKDAHNIFKVNRRSSIKTFQKHCDLNEIKKIFKQFNGSSVYLQQPLVKTCIETVLTDVFVPTVVHEILHNMGLQHNMHGSTDKDNYLTPELIKTVYNETVDAGTNPSNSNSIMDYFEYRMEDSPYPSTYDWAALRYIYRNQIQLSDGRMADLKKPAARKLMDNNVVELWPIQELEAGLNAKAKTFAYCMQVEMRWGTNPLCESWDLGHNPYTIVKNYIEEYEFFTEQYKTKGVRYNFNTEQINDQKFFILKKLVNYYHQWRKELVTLVGENNKYLESFTNSQDFHNEIAARIMSLSDSDRSRILEYYQVRNLIYSFLRDQVFKAPYTCVYNQSYSEMSETVTLDFDQIYRKMLSLSMAIGDDDVISCNSRSVQRVSKMMLFERLQAVFKNVKANEVGFELLGSVGYPVTDYSSNINFARTMPGGRTDVTGYLTSKFMAATLLLGRSYTPFYQSAEYYYPSFMDEPDFRENFEYFLKNRYVNGFWTTQETSDIKKINITSGVYREIFQDEKNIGFRTLLNSYGNEGARVFRQRFDSNELMTVVNTPTSEFLETLVASPHMHNEAARLNLEKSESKDADAQAQIFSDMYGMRFVQSYLSESLLIDTYSQYFRASLIVPNNLSVTADRTKRFQMGISSNDYAYLDYVKSRYPVFADLGSFLVYPKNDDATFARDLITELDALSSVDKAFANPDADVQTMVNFLGSHFVQYLSEYGKTQHFGLGNNFPTLARYQELQLNFTDSLNRNLARANRLSPATKDLIVLMANRLNNTVNERLTYAANRYNLNAVDRYGAKLNYSQALREIMDLKVILDAQKSDVQIPTAQPNHDHYQKTYDNLVKVIAEFQKNVSVPGTLTPFNPDQNSQATLAYNPVMTMDEVVHIVNEEANKQMHQSAIYRFDSKEFSEKKELLSKFLFTLAISR